MSGPGPSPKEIKFIEAIDKLGLNLKKNNRGQATLESNILNAISFELGKQSSPINLNTALIESYEFIISGQVLPSMASAAFRNIATQLKKLDPKGEFNVENAFKVFDTYLKAKVSMQKPQRDEEKSQAATPVIQANASDMIPPPSLPSLPPLPKPTPIVTSPLPSLAPVATGPPASVNPSPLPTTAPIVGQTPIASGPPPIASGPPPIASGPPPIASGPPPIASGPPPIASGPPTTSEPQPKSGNAGYEIIQPSQDPFQRAIDIFKSKSESIVKTAKNGQPKGEAAIIHLQAQTLVRELKLLQSSQKDATPFQAQTKLEAFFKEKSDQGGLHSGILILMQRKPFLIENPDELAKKQGFLPQDYTDEKIVDGKSVPQEKPKAGFIYSEILSSESSYLNSMHMISESYQKALLNVLDGYEKKNPKDAGKYLSKAQLSQLFNAFNEIKAANEIMFDALKNSPPSEWAKKFEALGPLYAQYSILYNKFKDIPSIEGLNLPFDQLIAPVQRLPRYVLLTADLARHVENEHPDKSTIEELPTKIAAVTRSMDTRMGISKTVDDLLFASKQREDILLNPKTAKKADAPQLLSEIGVLRSLATHLKGQHSEDALTKAMSQTYQEYQSKLKVEEFVHTIHKLSDTFKEIELKQGLKVDFGAAIKNLQNDLIEKIDNKRRHSEPTVPPTVKTVGDTNRVRAQSSPPLAPQAQASPPQSQPALPIIAAEQGAAPLIRQMRSGPLQNIVLEAQSQNPNAPPPTIQDIHAQLMKANGEQKITKYSTAGNQFTKITDDKAKFDTIGVEVKVPDRKTTQYFIQANNNGVTYSLSSNLSTADRDAALLKACKDLVATLTPDKAINLTGVANKEATHQALHEALTEHYGRDYASNPKAPKIIGVEPMKIEPAKPQAHSTQP